MVKKIIYGAEARLALKAGIDKAAKAVGVTLGPSGKTVMITRSMGIALQRPFATKDGISVLRQVELEDEMEDTGAMLLKMASEKTVQDAGDATTATAILCQAMVAEGIKALQAGINPISLRRGMEKAVKSVVKQIAEQSVPVEIKAEGHLLQVATVAANNNKEIGLMVATAIEKIGKDGVITIGDSKGTETEVTYLQGLRTETGWGSTSDKFVTNEARKTTQLDNPYILIYENKIAKGEDFLTNGKIAEAVFRSGRPLLVIADGYGDPVINSMLEMNKSKKLPNCCVALPGTGNMRKELIKDIAAFTGATITGFQTGFKIQDVKMEHLGQAEKVIVGHNNTLIFGMENYQTDTDVRVNELREQSELETDEAVKSKFQERIAKLTGGIAVISVGGNTEIEVREKKDRVDDAVRAAQSAIQEGVVVGGGVCLLNCAFNNELFEKEEIAGAKIVIDALSRPCELIAENCGKQGKFVVETIINNQQISKVPTESAVNKNYGYNALTDCYEDLYKAGIVDAAKVVRACVENASSIAIQVLTSEVLMCEERMKPQYD